MPLLMDDDENIILDNKKRRIYTRERISEVRERDREEKMMRCRQHIEVKRRMCEHTPHYHTHIR